ncbi:MAG: TonB-dependent receptor [Alphaproteobacteria bacterium]|nr:TonB-dependent receptor [Alphaproteobacteria bacterium]MBU1516416.1 TonB-dependent receptor [Alphaproteobacteria bacterium]MBU2093347.1 TonB-dependent receptor [Alphaproteobacteria bacterium]MBU2153834.1 TonB-dependent receptor [Alphaproteobacteria bacterium]MBU2307706.1 TonB-dependent receptor [Alphaproteobacteria bacterium]
MPRNYLFSAGVAALLIAQPAFAAEGAAIDEVIVTGTRAADGVDASKIGSSVTVITPRQMEDRQVRVVSDVLRDVPGFAVSRTGAIGGQTQIRVRGTEGNHVLTLIDGIEASDPFFGEFDFATLISDDVARIEILRGAQSALYGSDAIAGVINYITPTAAEAPGARMRVEFGSQDTLGGSARYAAVLGPLDVVVNAGVNRTGGYVGQTLPGGTRKLSSELESFSAKAGYQVTETLKLRGALRYTNTHAETNSSSFGRGQVDSPGNYLDATNLYYFLGGDLALLDGAWTHSLSYQGVDAERNGYARNARSSGDDGLRKKASYATTYRLETGSLTHRFTGAFDWEKETYQNTSPASSGADTTRRSIKNKGFVGQYDLEIGDNAGLGGAVRHDDNDFFDDATTWKVQGFYRFGEMIRVRAAGGTGIKNPSQTELFGFNATGPFPFRGNPNLKPEKSEGWEVGTDLSFWDGRVSLGVTYFDATLKNEIFSYFGGAGLPAACPAPPAGTSTTCNRTFDSKQKGVELFGTIEITDSLTVSGAYTDLNAKENGLEEIRRAPDIGSANITWKPLDGRATFNLNVRYNGKQLDSNFSGINPPFLASLPDVKPATGANAGKVVLPAYTLVNLAASYDLSEHVEVFGRVENLTDEDYYEVFAFPTQGRTATVGARIKF